ncbi:DUF6464 family protein [Nodosilinea sp. E11]|uniref:DUF6464 family protein n=1 Tax=Nodosilinea sp. E11 TaxID=3037479 RepID=UPI00293515DE|nr:DUF6464 family protein [Nodosilinea sp. E11]WOD40355.1 DUF6464 family protein [Nodosilinea sp. E11]
MVTPSINLAPRRQCRNCRFNARSPYLVCAVHPSGPSQRQCPDFESLTPVVEQPRVYPAAVEADWMQFWGPTEAEWLAFWNAED